MPFSPSEVEAIMDGAAFRDDLSLVRSSLANFRLNQRFLFDPIVARRLTRFAELVLASSADWNGAGEHSAQVAAEVSEMLAASPDLDVDAARLRLRAALLYEIAGLPMMAAAVVEDGDLPRPLVDFFGRRGVFRSLDADLESLGSVEWTSSRSVQNGLIATALCGDALELAAYEHGDDVPGAADVVPGIADAVEAFTLDFSLSEVRAFDRVLRDRIARSTRRNVGDDLMPRLAAIGFPPELWRSQVEAVTRGLLDGRFDAWSLAAPTGTGKSFLARLLIVSALSSDHIAKVLYLAPTKALVYQVASQLEGALKGADITVTAVTRQLVGLDEEEDQRLAEADVLVLTPEKADLLLRIGAAWLSNVRLVVVDEAHLIEGGTRGVLLELYLLRLKRAFAHDARYVFLSAVAPNIAELSDWMGRNPGSAIIDDRATRMKVGVYRVEKVGNRRRGVIGYTDGTNVVVVERAPQRTQERGIAELAQKLGVAGPVLVVGRGKKTAESLAVALRDWLLRTEAEARLMDEQATSPELRRLDSRLEREMYPDVQMRDLWRFGIAYHHAGLPPRVREAVEDAITHGLVRYVFATTTLAEGVNFPFSSVVVQALSVREGIPEPGQAPSYRLVTPRTFWNIAGRAGRPGFDREGQVILFEASLGLERVEAVIDPYVNPDIKSLEPVRSSLASGLIDITARIESGELDPDDIDQPRLSPSVPRDIRGTVNLLRVGIAHARASGITKDADEFFGDTLAFRTMASESRGPALSIVRGQTQVVDAFLRSDDAPSETLVAELGLSIETLTDLRRYIRGLQDWQLKSAMGSVVGGAILFDRAKYVLNAVLYRMTEFDGAGLSARYTDAVVDWCSGIPFSNIRNPTNRRLEDLISLMYSRIEYLLPWGLWAVDRFAAEEAEARGMGAVYAHEIAQLAYLTDAGVPNFDALRLVRADFERTDATRLSRAFARDPEGRGVTDVVGWLRGQSSERLRAIIRGSDRRAVDYDFEALLERI
jgi:DEAD/DEAH box helicase/Helicase conserved C-terminal domain